MPSLRPLSVNELKDVRTAWCDLLRTAAGGATAAAAAATPADAAAAAEAEVPEHYILTRTEDHGSLLSSLHVPLAPMRRQASEAETAMAHEALENFLRDTLFSRTSASGEQQTSGRMSWFDFRHLIERLKAAFLLHKQRQLHPPLASAAGALDEGSRRLSVGAAGMAVGLRRKTRSFASQRRLSRRNSSVNQSNATTPHQAPLHPLQRVQQGHACERVEESGLFWFGPHAAGGNAQSSAAAKNELLDSFIAAGGRSDGSGTVQVVDILKLLSTAEADEAARRAQRQVVKTLAGVPPTAAQVEEEKQQQQREEEEERLRVSAAEDEARAKKAAEDKKRTGFPESPPLEKSGMTMQQLSEFLTGRDETRRRRTTTFSGHANGGHDLSESMAANDALTLSMDGGDESDEDDAGRRIRLGGMDASAAFAFGQPQQQAQEYEIDDDGQFFLRRLGGVPAVSTLQHRPSLSPLRLSGGSRRGSPSPPRGGRPSPVPDVNHGQDDGEAVIVRYRNFMLPHIYASSKEAAAKAAAKEEAEAEEAARATTPGGRLKDGGRGDRKSIHNTPMDFENKGRFSTVADQRRAQHRVVGIAKKKSLGKSSAQHQQEEEQRRVAAEKIHALKSTSRQQQAMMLAAAAATAQPDALGHGGKPNGKVPEEARPTVLAAQRLADRQKERRVALEHRRDTMTALMESLVQSCSPQRDSLPSSNRGSTLTSPNHGDQIAMRQVTMASFSSFSLNAAPRAQRRLPK
jgi:hypothetical protein